MCVCNLQRFVGKKRNFERHFNLMNETEFLSSVGENSSERFIIKPDELQQCLFCLENKPVIFLKTTPEFAQRVRQLLKIEEKNENNWFDPNDAGRMTCFDKSN